MDVPIPKIGEPTVEILQAPFELDMIAYYNIVKQDVLDLIESGDYDSISDLAEQIDKLFE